MKAPTAELEKRNRAGAAAAVPAVVVVGSFNRDLTFEVAQFPAAGETVLGTLRGGPGGKGANQAVAAARAGARTAFVAALGDDAFGREAAAWLTQEGIEARIAAKAGLPTGTAGIFVDRTGQNRIVVALGANAALAPDDVGPAVLAGARLAIFQLESPPATVAHGLRTARSLGIATLLNPAPWRADFDAELLRYTDILVPNETEFSALVAHLGLGAVPEPAALADAELQRLCRACGCRIVIVTLGAAGCFVSLPEGGRRWPAFGGIDVVDTVGAGDAFVGGFASGWTASDGDPAAAVRRGLATAALAITRPGAAAAMPAAAEIDAFLATRL